MTGREFSNSLCLSVGMCVRESSFLAQIQDKTKDSEIHSWKGLYFNNN